MYAFTDLRSLFRCTESPNIPDKGSIDKVKDITSKMSSEDPNADSSVKYPE